MIVLRSLGKACTRIRLFASHPNLLFTLNSLSLWLVSSFPCFLRPERSWYFPFLSSRHIYLICPLHIFRSYPLYSPAMLGLCVWATTIAHPRVLIAAGLPHSILSLQSIQKLILQSGPTLVMSLWLNARPRLFIRCSVQDKFQTP